MSPAAIGKAALAQRAHSAASSAQPRHSFAGLLVEAPWGVEAVSFRAGCLRPGRWRSGRWRSGWAARWPSSERSPLGSRRARFRSQQA